MKTFCVETLLIKNHSVNYLLDHRQSKHKKKMFVSFLNVTAETPDEPLTEFHEQFADIEGPPTSHKNPKME